MRCCYGRDEFINGTCTGTQPFDESRCSRCTPSPSAQHYTLNPCTGQTRADQSWEACATQCAAGEYISKPCSNTSKLECSACKKVCPAGSYMTGSCNGNTNYDAVICVPCRQTCPVGQYRANLDRCFGNTTEDTVTCRSCRTQCASGEYIFGTCAGASTSDTTSCTRCTICPQDRPNQYNSIYRSCNGTDLTDVVRCELNPAGQTMVGDACPAGEKKNPAPCCGMCVRILAAVLI